MGVKRISELKNNLNDSLIELHSNRRIIVFDCKSVIDYSDETVVLDLNTVKLKIIGRSLNIDSFVFGQTDIKGEIISLEFC